MNLGCGGAIFDLVISSYFIVIGGGLSLVFQCTQVHWELHRRQRPIYLWCWVLNRINIFRIAPHHLTLKKKACIILIKNLDIKNGHCKGTRYLILDVTTHMIRATILSGVPNSEILIPRIPMISKDIDFPVPFKRLHFPVLGAYYLTLNRAQGQSLDRAGMYLPKSVFSHGHLYVGFSRCGDPDSFLFLLTRPSLKISNTYWTQTKSTQGM